MRCGNFKRKRSCCLFTPCWMSACSMKPPLPKGIIPLHPRAITSTRFSARMPVPCWSNTARPPMPSTAMPTTSSAWQNHSAPYPLNSGHSLNPTSHTSTGWGINSPSNLPPPSAWAHSRSMSPAMSSTVGLLSNAQVSPPYADSTGSKGGWRSIVRMRICVASDSSCTRSGMGICT